MRWDASDARGAPVQGYRLRISVVADGVAKETESVDVKTTAYTLRHIRPNTDYALQVEVRNQHSRSTLFSLSDHDARDAPQFDKKKHIFSSGTERCWLVHALSFTYLQDASCATRAR